MLQRLRVWLLKRVKRFVSRTKERRFSKVIGAAMKTILSL